MYREFFAGMEWTGVALFAMGFFLLFFVVVLLRVFLLRARHDYDSVARLPLDEPFPRTAAERSEVKP